MTLFIYEKEAKWEKMTLDKVEKRVGRKWAYIVVAECL